MSTLWITIMNEHLDPLKDASEGDKLRVPLGDLWSSSEWCQQRAILHRQCFLVQKYQKCRLFLLFHCKALSLSTSKLRKVPKDCKEIWKQEVLKEYNGVFWLVLCLPAELGRIWNTSKEQQVNDFFSTPEPQVCYCFMWLKHRETEEWYDLFVPLW